MGLLKRERLNIQPRFQVSYWDAAIIAAAGELGCQAIYTEDLNHGQDYDGVKAVNPFLTLGPSTNAEV